MKITSDGVGVMSFVEYGWFLFWIEFPVKYVQMIDVFEGFGAILVFGNLFPEDKISFSQSRTAFDVQMNGSDEA